LPDAEAAHFHASQAQSLAQAKVDFLMGATLPALSEALGMARAMATTQVPYVISFVIRPTGALLDGTALHAAMSAIDTAVHPQPTAYMVNCIHPTVLKQALHRQSDRERQVRARLLGLQANTSPKPPEELDDAACLESQDPDTFAKAMVRLHTQLGVKALGGCCGTDERHIASIARRVAAR
jgi:homocysteine S-methyltransferase